MTRNFLSRNCPICNAVPPVAREIQSRKPAESLQFDELRSYWINFFKEKVFFSYARCATCGLLYAPIFFDATQLEELYAQMPPNMEVVPAATLERTQRGYFELLRETTALTGGFVEVGPDTGLFTKNCVSDGDFSEYWLFEPNQRVKAALSATMAGTKFHIIRDMFGFSSLPESAATVVVMIHVMDHLLDPVGTLRELRAKLQPGGRIMLVTHDESSLLRQAVGVKWPAFCLQHPQIYNFKSMVRLFEAAGYVVVRQSKTVNYFPVSFLVKQLMWAFGLNVQNVPKMADVAIGLKLGNMLTIATPTEVGR